MQEYYQTRQAQRPRSNNPSSEVSGSVGSPCNNRTASGRAAKTTHTVCNIFSGAVVQRDPPPPTNVQPKRPTLAQHGRAAKARAAKNILAVQDECYMKRARFLPHDTSATWGAVLNVRPAFIAWDRCRLLNSYSMQCVCLFARSSA